ncbi:hypothetical protein PYCCODRAFT_432876 [Trametes coccinea BRFM310]|uniref:Uncharacterized protein n=1 Tax=Trametes coccinea (strain BRFM310) TaxID=1353009 RepID=A0A1Y2IMM8_TRAC3|nr:hypothetical protein PYCCODRAFT_432876 [Trametes coccinea BRFM310]
MPRGTYSTQPDDFWRTSGLPFLTRRARYGKLELSTLGSSGHPVRLRTPRGGNVIPRNQVPSQRRCSVRVTKIWRHLPATNVRAASCLAQALLRGRPVVYIVITRSSALIEYSFPASKTLNAGCETDHSNFPAIRKDGAECNPKKQLAIQHIVNTT